MLVTSMHLKWRACGLSAEYLGIISFQLHTLTCQAVVSFYTRGSGDEVQVATCI